MKYEDLKSKLLSDPAVKYEYDALEPEYQLILAIVSARSEQNISQQQLSDLTGINRSDISKLENGNANPSLQTIKRVAKGLGKNIEIRFV